MTTLLAPKCLQDRKSHFIQITGELRINGNKISSIRAVELLHLVVNAGYRMSRQELEKYLYGGFCARSSLWYPLKVCQKAGINISYEKETRSVVLHDKVHFDYDVGMSFLKQKDLKSAVWILNGWPLATQTNSYSDLLLAELKKEIENIGSTAYWSEIEEAYESLDSKCNRARCPRSSDYSCCFS